MNIPESCLDYYRETLKVGDFVVPIYEEAQKQGISGTITKIEFIPEENKYYLTIIDENGKPFDKIWYSRCFSTKERKAIRENEDYVYNLTCYNDKFRRIGFVPLTNNTDINYDIPSTTCYMTLDANHLEEIGRETKKERILSCYSYISLYYFILSNKLKLKELENENGPLLVSEEARFPKAITHDYELFESLYELREEIKSIITLFNEADLTNINNDIEYDKNIEKQDFETDLVLKLKKIGL